MEKEIYKGFLLGITITNRFLFGAEMEQLLMYLPSADQL